MEEKRNEILDDELLELAGVIQKVKIKKANIYGKIKKGEFPKPVKLGGRALWPTSVINQYIFNLKKAQGV